MRLRGKKTSNESDDERRARLDDKIRNKLARLVMGTCFLISQ